MAASDISRDKFRKKLEDLAASLRAQIEAEVDGFDPDPSASLNRVKQGRLQFWFFAKTYFPHYVKADPSILHTWLADKLPALVDAETGQHLALAAPRGEAKSTIISLIFVIYCIVYQLKHNIIHIMDTFEQSAENLEAIKAELEVNSRLALDFPHAVGAGRIWQAAKIITTNNIKVESFGSGKKIRGKRHGPYRPDLVIGDDLENDEQVNSSEQRDKLEAWLNKAVLKLGGADDTCDVIIVGTVLHYDSLLARLLKNRMWQRRRFRSIIQWPDRMDLWEQFEHILQTGAVDDEETSIAEAMDFYSAHQAEMDAGAEVSWPAARPLIKLMIIRARDGHAAFDAEHQNDPVAGENAPFANCIQFWVNRLPEWIFYGACDPSLGKQGKGRDPSALLIGGFNRSTGILDVVEALIRKRLPDRIIEDIIALQREYACQVWGIEAVQFQEFLRTELVRRSAIAGFPVPARAITPHADKELRIESLQPHIANGLIRLHPSQTTLLAQLRHFPKADHDDGPDALHMLWMLAVSGRGMLLPGAIRTPALYDTRGQDYGDVPWESYS